MTPSRAALLRPLLDPLVDSLDVERRIAFDPVEAPRSFRRPADQEIAGLLASSLAYGRADLFRPRLFEVLKKMGPSPAAFARDFDPARHGDRFASFVYRFHRGADVAALVAGAGAVLRRHGSLGARLAAAYRSSGSLRPALAELVTELRSSGLAAVLPAMGSPRALEHLLPDPSRGSACKRLLLYVRWMVRRDRVDLGAWEKLLPRSALVIPLDTHVMRLSRLLGLTSRRDISWRTAEEVTASLRQLHPDDPVRYDFALCHLGMSGACPRRSLLEKCRVCPLQRGCPTGSRLAKPRNH